MSQLDVNVTNNSNQVASVIEDKSIVEYYHVSARTVCCHFCHNEFDITEICCGEQFNCPRCKITLIRIEHYPVMIPIVYGLLALFTFLLLLIYPLLGVVVPIVEDGVYISVWGILKCLIKQDHIWLSSVFVLWVLITPLIFIFFTLYVYLALYLHKNWPMLKEVADVLVRLKPWIMVDIFFISVLVALVKIRALADVHLGYSIGILFVYSIFFARMILSISDYWLYDKLPRSKPKGVSHYQKQTVVEIQQRSRIKLHFAWALLVTAVIFYVPANMYPMMITDGIGYHYESNILEGVIQIWKSGDYLVSSVIFITSFLIPIVKIFILFIILLGISYKKVLSACNLTRCYLVIERIGRWSMIDVFVIILMTSLFNSPVVSISPGLAVIYFCLVVVITMVATDSVDIRLLWLEHDSKEQR